MIRIPVLLAPLLGALGIVALVGCNTAQVSQPAVIDAGPACPDIAPRLTCEAGPPGETLAGSCAGGITISVAGLDASSTFPEGTYPASCNVVFFTDDHAGGCLDSPSCTCAPGDAGPQEGDGGTVAAGVWSCQR